METRCAYGFGRTVDLDFDTALSRVRQALEGRGFGVLFQLEVGEILKNGGEDKEGRYVILGACNPKAASRAFAADHNIGLVLPCHLAVYEDGGGGTRVMVADPSSFMDLLRRPAAVEMAIEMRDQLEALVEDFS